MGHDHETESAGADPYDVLSGRSSCREALDTLYWYLDGELTAERRVTIRHHLEECSPCLEAFDFESELKALIARRCRDQVPDALRQRVADALAQASEGEAASPGLSSEGTAGSEL
jgi:mycothiol system anti-sigma-R factor